MWGLRLGNFLGGSSPQTPGSISTTEQRLSSTSGSALGSGSAPRSEERVSKSSYFLGDPPPDPRFLASLGVLSLVEFDHCFVVGLLDDLFTATMNVPYMLGVLWSCIAKDPIGHR